MASLNKCLFIGNVGKDPDIRHMPSGDAIASFSIAVTEKWKEKGTGEAREATEWVRVSAFGKLAGIIEQYVKKGQSVYIEGKMKTREYTDRDGVKKYSTEIVADTLQMLGGKTQGQESEPPTRQAQAARQAAQQARPQARPAPNFDNLDDDVPFILNMSDGYLGEPSLSRVDRRIRRAK